MSEMEMLHDKQDTFLSVIALPNFKGPIDNFATDTDKTLNI